VSWFVPRWPEGNSAPGPWLARAACLLGVLCWLSPAVAAPAKHRRRGHASPSKSEPKAVPADDAAPPADTLPPDSAGPPAEPSPAAGQPPWAARAEQPPSNRARAAAEDGAAAPGEGPAPRTTRAPPAAEPEAPVLATSRRGRESEPATAELEVGRRELARLAASRTEVAVMAGLDVGRRDFTYSDPIGDLPQSYRLAAAPLATVGMDVYPFASTGVPLLQDLGVRGRFSRAFAIASSTTQGARLETSWTRFGGDLRERILFPASRLREVGIAIGVDADDFALHTDHDVGALVPEARTVALRIGADGRLFVAGRVSLLAGAGYLFTLTRGQIYDRFRSPKVAGVDGDVASSVRLTASLDLRIGVRYTRYFASFVPQVGDALVAGGALDQQFQAGVGVRYAH